MAFVEGVPRGWLQTSPTECPTHDCGLHKNQSPRHVFHGSLLSFPKGLLVLSLPQQAKGHRDSDRGCVMGAGTFSQHHHVGRVWSGYQSTHWSALSAVCWALRIDCHSLVSTVHCVLGAEDRLSLTGF